MSTSNGNGNKIAAMWIAIIISATGAGSTITFALTRAAYDNTDARLSKIEQSMERLADSVEGKINRIDKDLSFRVEKANEEHKVYDIRIGRLEDKLGLK